MKIRCEYCESFIDDTDEKCLNCGGVNDHLIRNAIGVPQTIDELKKWCQGKNIPLEQARFFVGKDCREARAFGIYRDEKTENFIVYKNKSDGTRAIRYEGKDESYAVNELYQKLKQEILNQKQYLNHALPNFNRNANQYSVNRTRQVINNNIWRFLPIIFTVVVCLFLVFGSIFSTGPSRGYYEYNNQVYYYQPGDSWYVYNNGYWSDTSIDSALSKHSADYFDSNNYYSQYDASDFSVSGYYTENSNDSYDSDWDSDDSWDSSDSWDSGASDWDSDW